MANAIFPKAKEAALQGGLGLTGDVRWILVDLADYTYNAAHDFLDDVPSGARVAVLGSGIGGKSYTNGTFDCDDPLFPAVTGDPCEALIGYVHTGTEGTSRLIWFIDTGVTGLPVTPSGADIQVVVNALGVFTL